MADNNEIESSDYKWYDRKWVVILLLIVFFPVGFYALYKNRTFSTTAKWSISGVVVLLIVIGALSEEPETTTSSNTSETQVAQKQADETTEVQDDETIDEQSENSTQEQATNEQTPQEEKLKLGDSFRLGDFGYVVHDVQTTRKIGNQFISKEASANASFVIVSFEIENFSNETETVLTDDIKIKDQRGRTFSPSSDANTALSMSTDKDFLLSELQPGIAKRTKTAFEVPTQVVNSGFTIIIPEKGFWGSDEAKIQVSGQ
jgi:hypothetical protein